MWPTAVQAIADTIGASADTEMLNRAHRSLRASFQFLGGKVKWDFMRTEGTTLRVLAPFTVPITASAGQVTAIAGAGHGILIDDLIVGDGFLKGVRASATAAGSISFAAAVTGLAAGAQGITVSAVRDFYDVPSDWKNIYSLRLLNSKVALRYVQRRLWDRTIGDEFNVSNPYWYDLFMVGGKGKIRLIPPPSTTDQLLNRYYRRFFLASASGVASAMDIPEDYEEVPVAWAKWHFLTDKGEGRKEQATTWFQLAQEGIKMMLAEQTTIADEDLMFLPGQFSGYQNDQSTRWIDWEYS
jgi:hypothetical protein